MSSEVDQIFPKLQALFCCSWKRRLKLRLGHLLAFPVSRNHL